MLQHRWIVAIGLFVVGIGSMAAAQTLQPGAVASWEAPRTVRCELDGEQFDPFGDRCVYVVDLLESRDAIEIARWRDGLRETKRVAIAEYPYPVEHLTITDESKVNLSPEDLERAEGESERVAGLWSSRRPRLFSLPLGPPLAEIPVGSRFGNRRFINDEPRNPHSGIDFRAGTGTGVMSVDHGEVVLAEEHFFAGKSVFVDHGDGLVSMYFHLDTVAVETGDLVTKGQSVGTVGATGRVTGPHLHFGLRWRGARVDPLVMLGREPLVDVEPASTN